MVKPNFWEGKKVFITGHTGFKGAWLSIWLHKLGALVTGYSKTVNEQQEVFYNDIKSIFLWSHYGDIIDANNLESCITAAQPEIVFHLAAQPIVRRSYEIPVETFATNMMGSVNLLEIVRGTPSVKAVVMVTSDKCYKPESLIDAFTENDPLGGNDPYSASKACAEIAINSYIKSFFSGVKFKSCNASIGTARAGNIIGGGDWGEDRLIPDLARGMLTNEIIQIRSPNSVRPWQFVLDALFGYLLLAEKLYLEGDKFTGSWNFGPTIDQRLSVREVVSAFVYSTNLEVEYLRSHQTSKSEESALTIDASKAEKNLYWRRFMTFEESIQLTRDWYFQFIDGATPRDLCEAQLKFYMERSICSW